jgi:hypothetical protein
MDPLLSNLVSAYQKVSECGKCLTLEDWQKFMKKEENNTSFTCIAWLKGFCDKSLSAASNLEASGCLITWLPKHETNKGCLCLSQPRALL